MSDWDNPTTSSLYTDLINEVKARDEDCARMFASGTLTNIPTNTVRWSSTSNKWELWNGSAWANLTTKYMIDVDTLDGQHGSYYQALANATGTLPSANFNDTSHGNRGGGALHALVTGSLPGFMSSTDKNKLDSIENGATADQTKADIDALGISAAYATSAGSATSAGYATSAGSITGQGSLATKNSVSAAEIDANAVHQSELYTATSEQSLSLGSSASGYVTLTGGNHTFGGIETRHSNSAGKSSVVLQAYADLGYGSSGVQALLKNEWTNPQTVYITSRYVSASPPYDLGDGEFDLFVMACVAANGDVLGTYVAPDPVWVYNGSKKSVPDVVTKQGAFIKRKDMSGVGIPWEVAKKNANTMRTYMEAFKNAPEILVPVTNAIKNQNMQEIPHPFAGVVSQNPGSKVVMLDPFSTQMQEWKDMLVHDEFSLGELITEGVIDLSTVSNFKTPAGVVALEARFK